MMIKALTQQEDITYAYPTLEPLNIVSKYSRSEGRNTQNNNKRCFNTLLLTMDRKFSERKFIRKCWT